MGSVVKKLYMVTTGVSKTLLMWRYRQYVSINNYSFCSYQGLTWSGLCEAMLFADFCKRENLVFDEIHYQSKKIPNMAPLQMANVLDKAGILSRQTTHWSGCSLRHTDDLCQSLKSSGFPDKKHPAFSTVQDNAKNVLWILNPNSIRKFRTPGFSPRTVEGYVLQAESWKDIFNKDNQRKIIKSELLRAPSEIEQYKILRKIENENKEFMNSVCSLNLAEVDIETVMGNEKLFKLTKQNLEHLLGLIKQPYNWKML